MSFQPVLPLPGYAGWLFLGRTIAGQQTAHDNAPEIARLSDHFAEKIAGVDTVDDLMGDYRLLTVALGAFGLQDDIGNRFFIRKVLEEGASAPDALANRLTDKRYLALAEAFGFGPGASVRTGLKGFAEEILDAYRTRSFEVAVGDQNEAYRLALTAQRDLAELADRPISADGRWFSVMGSEPLRQVFQTAFGLPESFAQLDIDRQLEIFRDKTRALLGDGEVAQFSDPDRVDKLVQRFLLRSDMDAASGILSSQSIALALLGGAG